jgi:membrane dipeptidase
MIGSSLRYVEKNIKLRIVRSHREIRDQDLNIILGVEGGHIFDTTYHQIVALYGLGVRVFTVTWNNSNRLAHSAFDADKKSLTKLGREYVRKLSRWDVILDMSHASTRTVLDVCELCESNVIASHSCVRALNPSFLRNIDDRAIRAIYERGGVVGVNISEYHLGKYKVVDHIDHLSERFGVACAAIGTDFDGISDPVVPGPLGLARIERELLRKGYKNTEVNRIFSGNFLRVFRKGVMRRAYCATKHVSDDSTPNIV